MSEPIKIIQFTDSHLFADSKQKFCGLDTFATYSAVVRLAMQTRWPPDLIFLTGDNAQDPRPDTYERWSGLFKGLTIPIYALPGNHDDLSVMREILKKTSIRLDRDFTWGNWRFVFLDSNIPYSPKGTLKQEELEFLAGVLRENTDMHTLVCLHHHAVPVGSAWLDTMVVGNYPEFWAVLRPFKNVKGVLFGHIHQEFKAKKGKTLILGTPSTCFQFKAGSKKFALDRKAPGFRWLHLFSDGRIETGVKRLPKVPAELDLKTRGY